MARAVVTLGTIAGLFLLAPDARVLAFVAVALVAALALQRLGIRVPTLTPARLAAGARRAEFRGAPRLRDPDAQGRPRPRAPSAARAAVDAAAPAAV